jgi:PAS domain S-box-containing protein
VLRLTRTPFMLYAATVAVFVVAAAPVLGAVLLGGRGPVAPGGVALGWQRLLVALHVSADLLIGVAYVVIALTLVRLARWSRGAIPFVWAFVAFGMFIVACGLTHMVAALTVWEPAWWMAGGVKYATAAVSVAMAVAAPPLLPRVLGAATAAKDEERRRREAAEAAWAEAAREAEALATLNRVGIALAGELDRGRLLHTVVEAATRLTGAGWGAFVSDEAGSEAIAATPGAVAGDAVAAGAGVAELARLPLPGNRPLRRGAAHEPTGAALLVPVVSRSGDALGRLVLGGTGAAGFDQRAEDLAVGLAALAAAGLDNARLYAEARAGEERLRAAFESASAGMALVGLDGRWLRVNRALWEMLGYEEDELLRRSFQEVTHPDDAAEDRRVVAALLAGEAEAFQIEKRYLRRDGSPVWVLLGVALVRDEGGAPLHFVGQIQDVTGRKQAEAERERLAAIVESAEEAIIGRDLDGTITSWNRGAARLFGYSAEEAVGQPIAMLSPPGPEGDVEAFLAAIRRGERVETPEATRIARDGRRLLVSLSVSPVRDAEGRVVGASTIARDVSERRRLEELQRDYLAMVTHDLRTPLTAVRGNAQLLQRRGEYRSSAVEAILVQADRMQRLLDDLADVVRLEGGDLPLRRATVDLAALARREVAALAAQQPNLAIEVTTPGGPVVGELDGDRLAQVIANLLGNAAKYAPDGGPIRVEVSASDGQARLAVSDNGPGIDPEHQPKLFERFYRAGATGAGGLGLGLYISRMLVEAHGGTVGVESAPGFGSTFVVTLPLRATDPEPAGAIAAQ